MDTHLSSHGVVSVDADHPSIDLVYYQSTLSDVHPLEVGGGRLTAVKIDSLTTQ